MRKTHVIQIPEPVDAHPMVWVECPGCGEKRYIRESTTRKVDYNGLCRKCGHKPKGIPEEQLSERVPVTCPECGITRMLTRRYVANHQCHAVCGECKRAKLRKMKKLGNQYVSPIRSFEMAGCIVLETRNSRCEWLDACPHYERCLDRAAELNWRGWRAVAVRTE